MSRPKRLTATSTDGTTRCARCLKTYLRADAVRCAVCNAVRCADCIPASPAVCKACMMVKSMAKSRK